MVDLLAGYSDSGVAVAYALPAPALRPFVSTYSLTRVAPGADIVRDQVYPEWPNVRFSADGAMTACTGPGPLSDCGPICGIGPTSRATHFTLGPGHFWTVSLRPLGWTRLMHVPAAEFADRWEIVTPASAFARFAPLLERVTGVTEMHAAAGQLDTEIAAMIGPPARGDGAIAAVHAGLLDPMVSTVAGLAERTGLRVRALERLSARAFGFTPKLLLRRQRFLRSLSQYMLDPSLAWIDTLDSQYVDQAHFIRDFRRFMDTTPRAFAALPHPVLSAAAVARTAAAGSAMQVLHPPEVPAGIAMDGSPH